MQIEYTQQLIETIASVMTVLLFCTVQTVISHATKNEQRTSTSFFFFLNCVEKERQGREERKNKGRKEERNKQTEF